jgi:hypothetical protein
LEKGWRKGLYTTLQKNDYFLHVGKNYFLFYYVFEQKAMMFLAKKHIVLDECHNIDFTNLFWGTIINLGLV